MLYVVHVVPGLNADQSAECRVLSPTSVPSTVVCVRVSQKNVRKRMLQYSCTDAIIRRSRLLFEETQILTGYAMTVLSSPAHI